MSEKPDFPMGTPRWKVVLSNLFVLVFVIVGGTLLYAAHHFLTWRFDVGFLAGMLLCAVSADYYYRDRR